MSDENMTRSDRDTLVKIARQRERVAKNEARARAADLLADFEAQLDRRYAYDENDVWEKAATLAKETVAQAQKAIADECERLGIPAQFAPKLQLGWTDRGRNDSKQERAEMRRVATRQIDAAERAARNAIERQSVEIQEKIMVSGLTTIEARSFLESMPTAVALMPTIAAEEVRVLIAREKEMER